MKTMLAARYLGPHRMKPEKVSLPEIGDEEALIEVEACGFCGSDINIIAGTHPRAKAPLTLGHELSGRIVQINASGSSWQLAIALPHIRSSPAATVTPALMAILMSARIFDSMALMWTEAWLSL